MEMLSELDAAVTPSGATTPHMGGIAPIRKVQSSNRSVIMSVAAAVVLLLLGSASWYWKGHRTAGSAGVAAAAADTTPSLAVLPFENLGKSDDAYFADGMTEEISSRLGTLAGLRVIGRQSVRGYANSNKPLSEIGKELGVTYVLTGSVRWDRSQPGHSLVRVSPALLRVSDGTQIWSTPYEDEVTGVFKMQSKVAEEVAQALQLQLNPHEQQTLAAKPTDNVEAYDYFLRGTAITDVGLSGGDFLRAAALFQKAVDLDPKFAGAWAALANSHLDAYWFRGDVSENRLTMAKKALDKLTALKPDDALTHDATGNYYYHGKLDYDHALSEFAAAQRIAPNDAMASALKGRVERRQGKWADAMTDMRRAAELDPRNNAVLNDFAGTLTYMRSYAAAESASRKEIAISPEHFAGYSNLASARIVGSGDVNGALAALRDASQRVGSEELGLGLLAYAWPVFLDRNLARIAAESAVPSNEGDRLSYFTGRLYMAEYAKDQAVSSAMADSVISIGQRQTSQTFSDADLHLALSLAYAAKGDKARSLAEGHKGVDMVPVSRDAVRGSSSLVSLAYSAGLAGDWDTSIAALRQSLAIPSLISVPSIRLDPWFAPIRNDPRFQALLAGH
jgi:TolB-like protein